jgi:hypothetical protein
MLQRDFGMGQGSGRTPAADASNAVESSAPLRLPI